MYIKKSLIMIFFSYHTYALIVSKDVGNGQDGFDGYILIYSNQIKPHLKFDRRYHLDVEKGIWSTTYQNEELYNIVL